jgi:ketosteroid isomerase-like protein
MKQIWMLMLLLSIGGQLLVNAQIKNHKDMKPVEEAASAGENAIRALEARFIDAFNAGDINAMMKNYVPDSTLIVFDLVPRKEYRGADAYRQDWVEFFSHFKSTPKIAITDLGITVEGNVGFSHSFQHITGIDKQDHPVDRWVRVTDGYRKINGSWLIALEHISVPVDLKTGRPDFSAKP